MKMQFPDGPPHIFDPVNPLRGFYLILYFETASEIERDLDVVELL